MQKFSNLERIFLAAEFAGVFFTLVLPPVFYSGQPVSAFRFQWRILFFYALFSAFFLLNRKHFFPPLKAKTSFFASILAWLLSLGALIFISFFFNEGAEKRPLALPQIHSFCDFFKFFVMLVFSAVFEELLYRDFLLNAPCVIFGENAKKSFCAIFSCVFFALSHRYLDGRAVWNALFAGAVLLALRQRFRSLALPCAVHSAYNLIAFFSNCP